MGAEPLRLVNGYLAEKGLKVLWDVAVHWCGQQDEAGAQRGGHGGQCSRLPGAGGSVTWERGAGVRRIYLLGPARGTAASRAWGAGFCPVQGEPTPAPGYTGAQVQPDQVKSPFTGGACVSCIEVPVRNDQSALPGLGEECQSTVCSADISESGDGKTAVIADLTGKVCPVVVNCVSQNSKHRVIRLMCTQQVRLLSCIYSRGSKMVFVHSFLNFSV